MRRHEISGARWGLVADLLPRPSRRGGGRWRDHRQVLNGLLWRFCAGTRWRDLPERYGLWQTVHGRLPRWRRDSTLDRVLDRLRLRLDAEGMVDLDTWCVDGTSICASRSAAGARKKPLRASPRTTRSGARAAACGTAGPAGRRPSTHDPRRRPSHRRRNAAERCFGWLKGCRGVGTRSEKLAVNFLATAKLACARLLLQRLRPSDRT